MMIRKIVMLLKPDVQFSAALMNRPGVEVHSVSSEDDIDMALLNDLHSPMHAGVRGWGAGQGVCGAVRWLVHTGWPER